MDEHGTDPMMKIINEYQNNRKRKRRRRRECILCGRSPADDPNVVLFRFPSPGIRNLMRSELWARFCFPDEPCSHEFQIKLYNEFEMLCNRHFKPTAFADSERKKLIKSAVPELVEGQDPLTQDEEPSRKRLAADLSESCNDEEEEDLPNSSEEVIYIRLLPGKSSDDTEDDEL